MKSNVNRLTLQNIALLPWTIVVSTTLFLVNVPELQTRIRRNRKMDANNSWERVLYCGRIYRIRAISKDGSDTFNMEVSLNKVQDRDPR